MNTMTVDIETYSDRDIRKGVHKYMDTPSFDILLIAYTTVEDDSVRVVDLTKEDGIARAEEFFDFLEDPNIVKRAYNANFEITCLNAWFRKKNIPIQTLPEEWRCDMLLACYNGYPTGLGLVGKALGLPEDKQKDARGKRLIQFFCKPCRPTKSNGMRTRNRPEDAPEDWETFIEYNRQDVVTERAIHQALMDNLTPEKEEELWRIDRRINSRGVRIDLPLVEGAIAISESYTAKLMGEAKRLTGLENPNSPTQLKHWLAVNGHPVSALTKASIADILDNKQLHPVVRRVLELRTMLGKTSIKKYEAMRDTVTSTDGRAHDLFQFYGARTGRWAGRNIQLQNLPRNHMEDLDTARELVRMKAGDTMELLYDDIPDVLSQLIRTALIPAPGHRFIVADFSAIEARVIAWIAGVKWRQEAFAAGKDIYCASASQMFGVPVEKHGVNGELRQKGKIAELALGYGGGVGALKQFGADKMGLSDKELQDIVEKWRTASPEIPALWAAMEKAAKLCIREKRDNQRRFSPYGYFEKKGKILRLHLPSGRALTYVNARLKEKQFRYTICFDGLKQQTHKFEEIETYGGRLVENFVQAVARDCLGAAMLRLEKAGYPIVAHIHDEVVLDTPRGKGSLADAIRIMTQNEPWNEGLLMNADGFEAPYYKKD